MTSNRLLESRRAAVDAVTEAMKRDGLSWSREWANHWTPTNAATGKRYRGINRIVLAATGEAIDSPDGRWLTFSQAIKQGWHVREAEHAPAHIEYWSKWYKTTDGKVVNERRARELVNCGDEDQTLLSHGRLAPRFTPVFSAAQVEGVPELKLHDHAGEDSSIIDALVASSRCEIKDARSDSAYYSPLKDYIVMPKRNQFDSLDGYARVLAHEMVHSVAKEAGRDVSEYATNPLARAREELVAELGSVFICSDLGLELSTATKDTTANDVLANHAAYVKSWLGLLQEDPDALARAASEATRAADTIEARLPKGVIKMPNKNSMTDSEIIAQHELETRYEQERRAIVERQKAERREREAVQRRRQAVQHRSRLAAQHTL